MKRASLIAGRFLWVSLLYSFFEVFYYCARFPLSNVYGALELCLRNLLIFFVIGMGAYLFFSLLGKVLRRTSLRVVPLALSTLIVFPVYFYLHHSVEGMPFLYRLLSSPKHFTILLAIIVFLLLIYISRFLATGSAERLTGLAVSTFCFLNVGPLFIGWMTESFPEISRVLSYLSVVLIVTALYSLVVRVHGVLCWGGDWLKRRAAWSGPLVALVFLAVFIVWFASDGSRPVDFRSSLSGPSILLVILDTARSDRFSCYGYGRETTPFLRSFAENADLFREVTTTAPWTLPSHASIFTGLYPSAHGLTWKNLYLDERFETLAEYLRGKGYDTIGFCNNPWVNRENGLAQGFDTYVVMWREDVLNPTLFFKVDWFVRRFLGINDGGALRTNQWVMEWLGRVYRRDRPYFLFINLMECHLGYDAPDTYHDMFLRDGYSPKVKKLHSNSLYSLLTGFSSLTVEEWRDYGDIYDGDLYYLDRRLEELFRYLDRSGFLKDTIVIVTSDHGEHLGERNYIDHQLSLYEPLLRVPLIIQVPEGGTELPEVGGLVQTIDIYPTLIDLLGHGVDNEELFLQGVSLMKGDDGLHDFVVSEYEVPKERLNDFMQTYPEGSAILKYDRALKSIRIDSLKYIWSSKGDSELYDLSMDPNESMDLREERSGAAGALEGRLMDWLDTFEHGKTTGGGGRELDSEARQRLKALGYID